MTAKTFEEWCESPEGSEAAIRNARAIHSGPHAYGEAAWTASRATLLADRPDVAGLVSQLHDIDAPISDKAADTIEALAAQLAEALGELASVKLQMDRAIGIIKWERDRAERAEAEYARLKEDAEAFPRATSQPIGTNDWVIDVSFLKCIKSAHRKLFPDCADPYPDLETIEEVLLALEAARAAYPKDAP